MHIYHIQVGPAAKYTLNSVTNIFLKGRDESYKMVSRIPASYENMIIVDEGVQLSNMSISWLMIAGGTTIFNCKDHLTRAKSIIISEQLRTTEQLKERLIPTKSQGALYKVFKGVIHKAQKSGILGNWIPIEEIYPLDGMTVLGNNLFTELTGIPIICDYITNVDGFEDGFYQGREKVTVTHWTLLPETPNS